MRKSKPLIKDRTMESQGFARFTSSTIEEGGRTIIFSYPSGNRYRVPLSYLLQWYAEPRLKVTAMAASDARVIRSRKISDGHMVRIYLSDGRQLDVAWDVVLMACEPLYEHYGGLTQESKELTKRWTESTEVFRIQ
jgi:hypothetical protein